MGMGCNYSTTALATTAKNSNHHVRISTSKITPLSPNKNASISEISHRSSVSMTHKHHHSPSRNSSGLFLQTRQRLSSKISQHMSAQFGTEEFTDDKDKINVSRAALLTVPPKEPSIELTLKSAILIQKWYRRYLARLEARRRCTWQIFQSLEYINEADQLKLYDFFHNILANQEVMEAFNTHKSSGHAFTYILKNKIEQKFPTWKNEEELLEFTDPNSCPIESTYTGPHLDFPLSASSVKNLVKAFKQKQQIHAFYVLQVLHTARNIMKTYPNIRSADTSISNKITVCGDFHGKLEDLLVVFNKNGFPSNQNPYVINGDYVDRGKHSLEVAMLLFCYFILYPDSMFINRGNHEDCLINLRYGFQKEIIHKFDQRNAGKIIALFSHLFALIPLATVIDNKIFVCHGGISRETDLSYIQTIKRSKYISLLKPLTDLEEGEEEEAANERARKHSSNNNPPDQETTPTQENNGTGGHYNREKDHEWRYLIDLLWNDPQSRPGQTFNNIRGGGQLFGPDVTEDFLNRHNFTLLIRSHECKPRGYEFTHNNKLLTIFSASNYYELGSNNGAFVQIDSKQSLHFVEYISTDNIYKYSMHQRLNHFEESAILNLKTLIFTNKSVLMAEFKKYDTENKGVLPVSQWSKVLEDVMKLNLPWRIICKSIVKVDSHDNVIYETMFQDLKSLYTSHIDDVPLMEAIYRNKINLENIFRLIDIDNSGLISLNEFKEACQFFHEQTNIPFSEDDIQALSKSLDINNDGYIDLNEFLEAFRLVNKGIN